MKLSKLAVLGGSVFCLAACASTPMGPTVMVFPAAGKPFDQFEGEKGMCKQYAENEVRGQADEANSTGVLEGVGGTVLGAGLGAAIGGGRGAAIGAGSGAIAGTAVGANTSGRKQGGIQRQYNNAYVQCMVAKGNIVNRPQARASTTVIYTPPPRVIYAPPPPPTVVYQSPPPPPPTGPAPGNADPYPY